MGSAIFCEFLQNHSFRFVANDYFALSESLRLHRSWKKGIIETRISTIHNYKGGIP